MVLKNKMNYIDHISFGLDGEMTFRFLEGKKVDLES